MTRPHAGERPDGVAVKVCRSLRKLVRIGRVELRAALHAPQLTVETVAQNDDQVPGPPVLHAQGAAAG